MKIKSSVKLFPVRICSFFLLILLFACNSSKKLNTDNIYFQTGADTVIAQQKKTVIQPHDLLGIQVYSKTLNQEQAVIFNIPATVGGDAQGYQVNESGDIEMPVIGNVKVAGLNKDELQTLLVQRLTNYVKNPSVIVRFLQFKINVLGEVRSPGTQKFTVDKVTILDALGAAGDLTDFGKREDITVIREEGSRNIYHTIDLRSKAIFQSPVYLLQPNDIVYVKPSKNKLKALNIDPEKQRKTTLAITIVSISIAIITTAISFIR